MLILARKKGESLVIGEGIEITITDVAGDKVRLGINAPQDVKIVRSEIIKTQEENKSASNSALPTQISGLVAALKSYK